MQKFKRHTIEIDAAGKVPGRLATKIAMILMGKNKVGYKTHIDSGDKVRILNVGEIYFTGKKMQDKVYRHHSMHPGGLKEKKAKILFLESPREVLRHAVARMLPKNKMRTARMLRLTFK
ncbi:MAG: 50S ribosomal protein L13 [Candidatus Magasanikbacteria bacterium]|nr:50S ribosomal protein L13 [Candidatus Magasanikbacteria bacterium]